MLKILTLIVIFSMCNGFLLDNTVSPDTGGSSLSDQRYVYLMDLIGQERQDKQKIAQTLVSFQNELKSFSQHFASFNQSQERIQTLQISHLKTVSMVMKETIMKLEKEVQKVNNDNKILQGENIKLQQELHSMNYYNCSTLNQNLLKLKNESSLQQEVLKLANETMKQNEENIQLRSEIDMCRNETLKVKLEMYALTNYLKQKVDKINTNPIFTMQNQDIHNLFNQTYLTQQKISLLEKENQKLTKELDYLSQQHNFTAEKVDNALKGAPTNNQIVALTSASIHGPVDPDKVIKFPSIKTRYGITNVSSFIDSGIFTCEIPGVYLFSAFILAGSNDGQFSMHKNNETLSKVETSHVGVNTFSTFHTGTGVLAVILDAGDTLYVKAFFHQIYVISGHSCITIIRIG